MAIELDMNQSSVSQTLSQLEDCVVLDLAEPELNLEAINWHQYNPRKQIPRWGASITSLDGGISGIPDIDSLVEFNKLNGTHYQEMDFKIWTPQAQGFQEILAGFHVGRSHFIKLGSGGFFPPHRDMDFSTFRILYTISGCMDENFIWITNGQQIRLRNNHWYYLNTKKAHNLFSHWGSVFAVFNILQDEASVQRMVSRLRIK
jgi:hypothetical protein